MLISIKAKNYDKILNKKSRFLLIKLVIFTIFSLFIYRIYDLSVSNQKVFSNYKSNANINFRKDIVDRNGKMLATNLVTYSLYVNNNLLKEQIKLIEILRLVFPDISKDFLEKKLFKKKNSLSLIKRDITKKQKDIIEQLGILGVTFHEDIKRVYPHKNLFSHIIGYVDKEENGLTGIEKSYNSKLRASDSNELRLSLDLNVQNIVKEELLRGYHKFNAQGGVAVIMDISNGEIISLVSLPDYDPYKPWVSLKERKYNNRASYDLYEMGSTFKIFTMALALNENVINLDDMFDVSNKLKIDKFKISDFKKTKEPISAREVFIKSSNIGTAKIALKLENKLPEFLKLLRIFDPLKLELVEKTYSKFPNKWENSRLITSSYGYGVSTTVIHLMQSFASILNQGNFHYATLIKDQNYLVENNIKISEEVKNQIIDLMHQAVIFGTGRRAKSDLYSIGGKTGTANKIGVYGYDETRLLSSFLSFFPVTEPKYMVYVNYDEPIGNDETNFYATGGVTAAPTVKKIIERVGLLLSVNPDKI